MVSFGFRRSSGLQHWISAHPHLAGQAPSTFTSELFLSLVCFSGFLGGDGFITYLLEQMSVRGSFVYCFLSKHGRGLDVLRHVKKLNVSLSLLFPGGRV